MWDNGLIHDADWQEIKDGIIVKNYKLEYSKKERNEYKLGSRPIKKGEIIGFLGTSGNSKAKHLHFGYFEDGTCMDIFGDYFTNYDE